MQIAVVTCIGVGAQRYARGGRVQRIDHHIVANLSLAAQAATEAATGVKLASSCRENCARYGHMGALDTLLNYRMALDRGELSAGDVVLIQNSSPAACWSSMRPGDR